MSVIVTGSIATDYIMKYPGHFREHILIEQTGKLSVSFLVEEKQMSRGGIGPNIAYTMALLGERPRLMGTVGPGLCRLPRLARAAGHRHRARHRLRGRVHRHLHRHHRPRAEPDRRLPCGRDEPRPRAHLPRARQGEIDYVIISPHDPEGMVRNCAECRELGPASSSTRQQLARLSGEQVLGGMQGAYALTVNDYELELHQVENRAGRGGHPGRCVSLLVVTRGADGATLMSKDRRVDAPIAPATQIVDPTGVGDAFRGGLLDRPGAWLFVGGHRRASARWPPPTASSRWAP
jgi:adenosine kinase